MRANTHWKPSEALAVGIRSEIEAASAYRHLLERVKNQLLQEKLKFLVFEEEQHRKILERLFSQRFAGQELEIPEKSFLSAIHIALDEKSSVLDLFKQALIAEKMSENFYKETQNHAEDTGTKKMLQYLSRVERSHFFMIKSEIELLSRFPEYYDVEDFHVGQDMFHVGP
jgi:rubrerythrin